VYDCAASIYLDRFLNRPPEALPAGTHSTGTVQSLLDLLDTQGQVNRAGEVVASVLNKGETAPAVMAAIGEALLREDSGFHTYQAVEASFRLHEQSGDSRRSAHALVAAARYVAAHTPTRRAGVQTFEIAQRLLRGDSLMEV
jgi:hypothetical protein